MNVQEVVKYFKLVCNESKTFEIDSWIRNNKPIIKESRCISNPNTYDDSNLNQSLFLAGPSLHMGVCGDDTPGSDAVDLIYNYHHSELRINYSSIDIDVNTDLMYILPIHIVITIFNSEEEHFQNSLINESYFTFEEEKKMQDFFLNIRKYPNIPIANY